MSSVLHLETARSTPYQIYQPQRKSSGALSRFTTSIDPSDRNEYSSTGVETIRFKFDPSLGWVDFAYGNLYATAEWVGELGAAGAASFFRRIELYGPDGQLLFELDDADILANVLRDVSSNADQESHSFSLTDLTGTAVVRQEGKFNRTPSNAFAPKGKTFCIQPLMEFCRSSRYIPMHSNGGFSLVFTLQRPDVCLRKFDTNDVSFKLRDVSYKLDVVTFDAETEKTLLAGLAQDMIEFHFQSWGHVKESSADQVAVLNIPNNYNSLIGILIKPRLVSSTTDVTKNSYASYFGDMREIRVKVGNQPQSIIKCDNYAPQAYFELSKLFDMGNNTRIVPGNWISDLNNGVNTINSVSNDNFDGKFVFGFNLQLTPGNPSHISGNATRAPLTVEFHRNTKLPDNERVLYDVFLLHDRVIRIGSSIGTVVRM